MSMILFSIFVKMFTVCYKTGYDKQIILVLRNEKSDSTLAAERMVRNSLPVQSHSCQLHRD